MSLASRVKASRERRRVRCAARRPRSGHQCEQGAIEGFVPLLCGTHHRLWRERGLMALRLPLRDRLVAEALSLKVCHRGSR